MKKKLNVSIYKSGSENDWILKMVANYNEGISDFSPRDLEGYFKCSLATFPTIKKGLQLIKGEEPNCYHVSEDGGKTFTLSLEWAEIYELSMDTEGLNGAGC